MPTLKAQPIRPQRHYVESHGHLGDEAASQTFRDGNLISPDASGKYQATAAGATAAAAKNRIAAGPGQNLASPLRKVPYVDPNLSPTVEITAIGVASAANIKVGATYGYSIDGTTGFGCLNLADTTTSCSALRTQPPLLV